MTDHHSWEAAEKLSRDGLISPVVGDVRTRSRARASRGTWLGRMAVLTGLYLACTAAFKGQIRFGIQPHVSIEYRVGDVKWSPCTGEGEVEGAECGYAVVPLDYTDRDVGVAKIALGRYKSTSGNRKGSVFLNPGGPGSPGKWLATQMGPYVQMLLGEDYDVIGFDPRGIGETEPQTQCFPSPGTHFAFIANTVLEHGFDVGPNLTDPKNRDHLIHQQREADALWQTQMRVCEQTMGDKLRYMGTVNIARDIEFMTSLLDGEGAPINYYGLSYGTVLGQFLVNLFPDRVGRVVLDGVVDAIDWTTLPAYKWGRHLQTSSEAAYQRFMSACAEVGPLRCALAKEDDEDPDVIMSRVESFIEDLHYHPLAVHNATMPGILTSGRARLLLFAAIEAPELWSIAALALDMAMNGDGSAALDVQRASIHYDDLQRSAISCNDNTVPDVPTAEEVIDEHLWVLEHVTRFSLAGMVLETDFGCHHWPVTPPERFTGPWNHALRNPILIVSNTADPITPLATGKLVNDRFGSSSRLLVQDSAGHCALAMPSLCMIGNMRAFFADGTLPEEGTVCPMDGSQFPDPDAANAYSMEDKRMLESARRVAKSMLKKW
ncbi:alpha/beta-hydrolase [Trametes sanguinea]|nr:alpha/beta-hydrolase [Trametes sanguinea]